MNIYVSSNEQNAPDRVADLMKVIGSMDGVEWTGFDSDLPCDLCCVDGTKEVHIEVKELPDFHASVKGRLGSQLMAIIESGSPGFIAVMGTLREALGSVPPYKFVNGRTRRKNQVEILAEKSRIKGLVASFEACNVPVRFLDKDRVMSFGFALTCAKSMLSDTNPGPWLPRFDVAAEPYAALSVVNGIGNEAAKALIKRFGCVAEICYAKPDDVADTPMKKSRLGHSKAAKVMHMLGCGIPANWGEMQKVRGVWTLCGGKYGKKVVGV